MSTKIINSLKNYLNTNFLEREEIIDGLLASIIAQENVLLIGNPGTAKGNLVMELSKCFQGVSYFQWLLTKYTVPEEIFGALSLKELEIGIYKRNTANKLPVAHIAFLDEIFKANSAILNTLLTVINEKLFYNNGTPEVSPLMSVIGASNEYAEEDENLDALDDRFVMRFDVEYVKDNNNFLTILKNGIDTSNRPVISLKDISDLQNASKNVVIEQDIFETILKVKEEMKVEGLEASTRRWCKAVNIVKANAAMNGCNTVDNTHLEILKHVLWRKPDERKKIAPIVKKFCADSLGQKLADFIQQAKEINSNAVNEKSTEAGIEANKKMKNILAELDKLKVSNPAKASSIDNAKVKVDQLNKEVLTACMGI